jgi:hypothetical protein
MKTPKEIESLAKGIQFEPDASADERILSSAEAALDNRTDIVRVTETRLIWRQIMRSPIAKLTIAAAVVVAVLLVIHFSGGTSATAWAAVLEKVNGFDTCIFRTRDVETTGPRPDGFEFASEGASTVHYSETYGGFSETYRNDELFARSYTLLQANEFVYICYPLKTYHRAGLTESQIHEFHNSHPKRIVTKILEGQYTKLGEDVIEGKRVIGIELRDPNVLSDDDHKVRPMDDFFARFWIDTKTELPVWVEISLVRPGSSKRQTTILDQFQWGVPLEASLFEPNIPADFERDNPEDRGRYMDSAPKTRTAEAFAENTQAEPYLSDFDHLALLDLANLTLLGLDTSMAQTELRLRNHEDVWQTQDEFMAKWPRFEDVRDQLAQELQAELGVEQMAVEELVGLGIALRERFWELRGCLSDVAYPYGYAARIVTERAHEQAPDNAAVTDQFVESIMTCEVTSAYRADPNERISNPIYPGLLTELRSQQFEQLKVRVSQGYVPTWKDYVRLNDLVMLLNSHRKDYAGALQVTRWMIDQAQTAGWTYYLETHLYKMEQAYANSEGYRTGLFMHGPGAFPEEYRYARRLFSFQGPRERRQKLLPVHLRHLKGW